MTYLLKGLILGLFIAAPVGPIGLLCINRTLHQGGRFGFVSGLGAATTDAFYGSIAAFGLDIVSNFLVSQHTWIRLIGGTFLVYLGVKGILSKPAQNAIESNVRGLFWNYSSTLALTLTNPMTIFSFVAVFAAMGVQSAANDYLSAAVTVLGVFLGSSLWWLTLSSVVHLARLKLHHGLVKWIGVVSSLVILGFGIAGVWTSGFL